MTPSEASPATRDALRIMHRSVREVTHDVEHCEFNTAISRVMELTTALRGYAVDRPADQRDSRFLREAIGVLIRLVAPFAPHFGEELWERTGRAGSVFDATWPAWDPELAKADEITIVIQVQGKVRSRLQVEADAGDEHIKSMALQDETVQKWVAGKEIRKVIVVPKKLVNIVI